MVSLSQCFLSVKHTLKGCKEQAKLRDRQIKLVPMTEVKGSCEENVVICEW